MRNSELLAPAGNERSLRAAVQAGADAVYLGGSRFNARQSADNFTTEEMSKWIDYCHLYGVKVYVTVNTLIKERETEALAEYAKELNSIGVDGVIVQDLGAVSIFLQTVPDLPVHASTQMTVTSAEAVRFLEKIGIKRVVLARELSFKQIREISDLTKAELEIFVHGALCMCYSGQCLMSSVIGGRSGNRGRCAQPCRLKYSLLENGNNVYEGYLLSPKDLNLSEELRRVLDSGSVSLKIEGRLKRAEYVASVVSVYRKYLDSFDRVLNEDKKILLDAFNRGGFTKGFFGSETGVAMMCHDNPSNVSENKFPEYAVKMSEENANFRKIPVYMYAEVKIGAGMTLTVWDDDSHSVSVTGTVLAEKAKNKPLTKERLSEQLKKLGDTPFVLENAEIVIDEEAILPISEINNIRRQAMNAIAEERKKYAKRQEACMSLKTVSKRTKSLEISVEAETKEQLEVARRYGIKRIYVPEQLAEDGLIVKTPDIAKTGKKQKAKKLCISNISDIHESKELYGGVRLNVYNSYTIDMLGLKSVTLSPELNIHEISDITKRTDAETEIIAYGRLTLMIMANCPVKSCGKCAKGGKKYSLKDRKNEEFPILCSPDCAARLLNSKPLYMADKWSELKKTEADFARLVFTTESGRECEDIIKSYLAAQKGEEVRTLPENSFTRGHFFRGVE